jgi:ATP-dependent Clp protease ATP-binding subunit ClpA
MTSNLGSSDSEKSNIGFGSQEKTGEDDKAMKEFFKPEFRNRVDLICKFKKLDTLAIKKIVLKFTEELKKSLIEKHNISLNLSEPVVDYLAEHGYDKKMGARPLARIIDNEIKSPLSRRVLFGDLVNGGRVTVDIVDDKLNFTVVEIPKPLTKEEKKALRTQRIARTANTQEQDATTENQIDQS